MRLLGYYDSLNRPTHANWLQLQMVTLHIIEAAFHKAGIHKVLLILVNTVASSMMVAYLSYRYYESYFLALKSKFQTAPRAVEITKGKLSPAL